MISVPELVSRIDEQNCDLVSFRFEVSLLSNIMSMDGFSQAGSLSSVPLLRCLITIRRNMLSDHAY